MPRSPYYEDVEGVDNVTPKESMGSTMLFRSRENPDPNMPNASKYPSLRPGWTTEAKNIGYETIPARADEKISKNYGDPAFDPDREVLGSRALGRAATGSDAFSTELSKLGNGFFLSLSRVVGADKASKYLENNVKITSDFQKLIEKADPMAAKIGKGAAIVDAALLTTPIWGMSFSKALVTGYAGALSSMLADKGSDEKPVTRDEVLKHGGSDTLLLGILGAGVGNGILRGGNVLSQLAHGDAIKFMKSLVPGSSRSTEAAVEGTDPEHYAPEEGFKEYIKRRLNS